MVTAFTHSTAYPAVDAARFGAAFNSARAQSDQIRRATSEFEDRDDMTLYVLAPDSQSGYAIREDGELVYVFSLVPGRGMFIVSSAIADGAVYLDCFDGYLPTLYRRHGFEVVDRVSNWTSGSPDVVFMALPGYQSRHGVA
jgi:outer membrane protein assembly factor BamB